VYLPLLLVNAMNAGVEYVGHAGEQDAAVRKAESARAGAVIAASVIGILWLNVLSFMIGAVSDYLIDSCGELIVARLRSDLYMHILRQEIAFFDKEKIGELVSRLGADTILVQQAVTRAPTYMFTGIFKLLCAFAVMSVLSFKLMFVSTLLIAPVGLTIAAMRMLSGIAER
jgi:ATP-binding cassette subfamily B protein